MPDMKPAFEVEIGDIKLDHKVITGVEFGVISPEDVDAKGAILCTCIKLTGNILNTSGEQTIGLATWATDDNQTTYEYKKVSVTYNHDNATVRQYILPQAFVVDYREEFGDHSGNGTFEIVMNQKRQYIEETEVNGGF